MTQQQPDGGGGDTAANPEQAPGGDDVGPLRRAVGELRDVLESKVSAAWIELIEPQGELLDSLRKEVRAKRKRKKQEKAEYRECLEDAVTAIASQLYSLALRKRAFDSLRAIIADEVSDDLASQVDSEAVLQTLRGAIAAVFDEARNRLEVSSTSAIADIKKGRSYDYAGRHQRRWFSPPSQVVRAASAIRALGFIGTDVEAPPRPGRWTQFNQWLDSCRQDLSFVRYEGSFVLMPAIMSEFDNLLARPQPANDQE